jgi:hypothetical protein
LPDPAIQFPDPYLGIGNNPVMYVDPDGEFVFIVAGALVGAYIGGAMANDSFNPGQWDYQSADTWIGMGVGGALVAFGGKKTAILGKAFKKKGIKAGLKSGTINSISNYDSKKGLGAHTITDFVAGYAGGALGVGSGKKWIGMSIGGLGTWGANGAEFSYKGAQEFVGGALSSYIGMGKAVKGKHAIFKKGANGKALFKKAASKKGFFYKHGDNFFKYGFQNNAYDFAYTKEDDFKKRQGGHADLFLWGGVSGAYQGVAWKAEHMFGTSLLYQGIDWSINGIIKKRYKGIKIDGSQANKGAVSYYKWLLQMKNLSK